MYLMNMKRKFGIFLALVSLAVTPAAAQDSTWSLVVNEVMSANVDGFISPTWNFDGWVELYNPTDADVELGGLYFSDKGSNLKKWRAPERLGAVPAHGYRLVWFDNNELLSTNVPFKLDLDGGTLYISDHDGTLLSQTTYPEALERASWARTTDGGDAWAFTSDPTPLADNSSTVYAYRQLEPPTVEPASGFFDKAVSIRPTVPDGCELYYTLDGTLPTKANGRRLATKYLIFKEPTIVRFRLYRDGLLASPVVTRSYLKRDRDYSLPTVSVVADPRFLYDDSIGIYTRGVNGKPGIGQWVKANWNMEWDRPVSMSYIDTDGNELTAKDVDMRIVGGWSRGAAVKSFKLKGRKEYGGDRDYHYPFFAAKPYLRSRTLHMRNGGNDEACKLKDPALATIIQKSGIDLDVQSYLPVHHFINGRYMGVINMREPSNKHFVYANRGWDSDEIDMFEMNCDSAYIQQCGTREGFERLYELSKSAANPSVYQEIKQWLDIDEYVNYMAMSLYLGRGDWPHNNMKGYRKTDGGRLRLVAFDIDAAFEQNSCFKYFEGMQTHTFNALFNGQHQIMAEIELVTIFLNLLKNSEFRSQFATAYSLMGGSVFDYERSCDIIDSLCMHVEPALALEGKSAQPMALSLRSHLKGRMEKMMPVMGSYSRMMLSAKTPLRIRMQTDGTPGARLLANSQEVPYQRFDGMFYPPAKLQAVAPAGYRFKGWTRSYVETSTVIGSSDEWAYSSSFDSGWEDFSYDDSSWPTMLPPVTGGARCLRTSVMLHFRPSAADVFTFVSTSDVPFALYVNGKKVAAEIPAGSQSTDISFETMKLGRNVFAVEMLDERGTSLWLAHLKRNVSSGDQSLWTDAETLDATTLHPADGNDVIDLTATFEPLTGEQKREAGAVPVRINEVSAVNDVFVSDHFKRSDWIELYNTTGEPVDITGLQVTIQSVAYTIQKASVQPLVIPPYAHLVVWCDRLEPLSQAHLAAKLPDAGGLITISPADGAWEDTFDYPAHDGQTSIGRYPDGADALYVMHRPTIGLANRLDSYTAYLYDAKATGIEQVGDAPPSTTEGAPGPMLSYAEQRLTLSGQRAADTRLAVYTSGGQQVPLQTTVVRSDFAYADLPALAPGVYLAVALTAGRSPVTLKFVINR